jgi:diguanylate cyclase (GGDEF)-like protein
MLQDIRTHLLKAKASFIAQHSNADLIRAKLAAFTRQVPLMYGLIIANTFALALTHYSRAPIGLTVYLPGALYLTCLLCVIAWWRERKLIPSHSGAIYRMYIMISIACLQAIGFAIWSLSLFPYGDAYTQGHVAFFLALTAIGCGFCLMHLRAAALLVMGLVVIPFAVFFSSTGNLVFIAVALNFILVVLAVSFMVIVNNRYFEKGIDSRKALLAKQQELLAKQRELQELSDTNFRNSHIDSLTDLPNRRYFFSELEARMDVASQTGGSLVVGILDLDGFKPINDVHGHRMGDRLLQEVGHRLRCNLSASTFLARMGGDEFVLISAGDMSDQKLISRGDYISELLSTPFEIDGRIVRIGCSIGFAMFPSAAKTAQDLFERADYALYFVKQHDRGNAVIFSAEHEASIRDASLIDQALLNADLESELSIAYQPITDIDSGRPIGFEALARWHSPTLGDVPPVTFITAAERSGSIGQLTPILLRKALEGAAAWPRDIRISFNLSALDVASPLSVLKIVGIVEQSGIDAGRIDFEVTETAVMRNRLQAAAALDTLKALGARIALDDFGTGYSSLGCIRELPLDKIKIDRSFVRNIETDPASLTILKTLVGLCSNLQLDCIVEGVETPRQLQLLRGEGCRFIQGYLFSKPLAGDQIDGYLAACEGAAMKVAVGG